MPLLVDFSSSVANSRSRAFRKSICAQGKSLRMYTSIHSGGLELTKLTYTRLEDNLIRHRGDIQYRIILLNTNSIPAILLSLLPEFRSASRQPKTLWATRQHYCISYHSPFGVAAVALRLDTSDAGFDRRVSSYCLKVRNPGMHVTDPGYGTA